MGARTKKTWREKLCDNKGLPRIVRIPSHQEKRWGKGTMVIPAPAEVDQVIRTVRKGRVTTINELRTVLAQRHQASTACPITTGIFAWIAAHAAAEDEAAGKKRVTPWWRVVKEGRKLNPKFPGGLDEHRRRLEAEGHVVRDDRVVEVRPA
ncbi:MAG: MGMT family protein [Verrucomicrobiales bacterium]|nr:MGMT family protein [Verrucomicrobiales bacterium]